MNKFKLGDSVAVAGVVKVVREEEKDGKVVRTLIIKFPNAISFSNTIEIEEAKI